MVCSAIPRITSKILPMLLLNSPSLWVMPTADSISLANCSVIRRVVATF
ncbi:Uncharacterised protein [Vibrio cholerae]|nr:Uncharacterised protein [Vibrio cholerae]